MLEDKRQAKDGSDHQDEAKREYACGLPHLLRNLHYIASSADTFFNALRVIPMRVYLARCSEVIKRWIYVCPTVEVNLIKHFISKPFVLPVPVKVPWLLSR